MFYFCSFVVFNPFLQSVSPSFSFQYIRQLQLEMLILFVILSFTYHAKLKFQCHHRIKNSKKKIKWTFEFLTYFKLINLVAFTQSQMFYLKNEMKIFIRSSLKLQKLTNRFNQSQMLNKRHLLNFLHTSNQQTYNKSQMFSLYDICNIEIWLT